MENRLAGLFMFLFFTLSLHAQTKGGELATADKNNTFYVEALGNGGLFSINYDRTLFRKGKFAGFARLGLTEWHSEDTNKLDFGLIGELGLLMGGPIHYLDLGMGYTHWTKDSESFIVPRVSYRFVSPSGLFLRISPVLYIISSEEDSFGGYWLGAGIGYTF